jgi:hypothetical protein
MKIAANEAFERRYIQKFRAVAAAYGEFVQYEKDRAARDLGLHFTQERDDGVFVVTPALAWFQLKGIRSTKLSKADYKAKKDLSIELETRHLRFWHLCPVNTYLVVYVECADEFFVINISKWINSKLGDGILADGRTTIKVNFSKENCLDDHAFSIIRNSEMVVSLKGRLAEDEQYASRFLRDARIIKEIADTSKNKRKIRARYIKWISKTRSEVYFEMLIRDKWELFRSHWQFMMGGIEGAFPYLRFFDIGPHSERDEEDDGWDNEYDESYSAEDVIVFGDGSKAIGSGGWSMERSEILLGIELNELGKIWAATLRTLERADVLVVADSPEFVSVAPWHARDL